MIGVPFQHTSGPKTAKIALIGEAWGEEEDKIGIPFVGASGKELSKLLFEADIKRSECFLTNVIARRPEGNNFDLFCGKKKDVEDGYRTLGIDLPPLKQGVYLLPHLVQELVRLKEELDTVKPNLVVCLGAKATWAMLGASGISSLRGAIAESRGLLSGHKVLPTYHPSALFKTWAWRPIVIADLMKARIEMAFAEVRRPFREVLVNPSLLEIWEWSNRPAELYGVDIETFRRQIRCIGFARSASDAIVIPFVNLDKPSRSHWDSLSEELQARKAVQAMLESPVPKLFQNGLFDMQYIWREGFRVKKVLHDSMLKHHSIFPELQKGLGFLGSVYSNEASWKLMKIKTKEDFKRDE